MAEVRLELDTALKERLHRVLDDPQRPVTEAELRKLSEEGGACTLILGADLERLERQLAQLDGDPASHAAAAPSSRPPISAWKGRLTCKWAL